MDSRIGTTPEREARAVVIGAGFGGLAAAVRLVTRGYTVTLLDRLDQPGGRARVFEEDGFVFDGGPTVITAPFLLEELWDLAGKEMKEYVDLRPVDPFYRIRFDDGTAFDYTGDLDRMKTEIARFAPDDVEGYERFLKKSEDIFRVGFEQLGHIPFDKVWDMAKIVPAMMKLESYRTVYSLVSKYIKNEKIRQVLSFHPLLVGGNPFKVTSIYSLILFLERKWGVHYAIGGTGAIVKGLVDLLLDLGVDIRLNTEVRQIRIRDGVATGVVLADGEEIDADIVVSNADVAWTYKYLVPANARRRWTNRRIDSLRYSMGLFVWYFGTKRKYPDVVHHTILLGPRYKGLLRDVFDRKILADDFSLYLHRPTATDPGMAPPGCDSFYVLSPVPHLDSGIDWIAAAESYRQRVSRYLSDSLLPGLEEELVVSRMLTPADFEKDYLSYKGAAFSVEPVLTQSAYFRPHNRSEDVEGLFFTGAGTHPGAGLPGVLSTARVLDTVVPAPDAVLRRRAVV
ncbi:MAG: phytoene desaturase [Rhodothermales bacterium]|nr:phytoene desaturase [Rhodothermales bacterium]